MKTNAEFLEIYKKHATPPAEVMKTINAGRLKGMSDIKPQWRIQALTESFGLCGFGWKYEVVQKTIIQGAKEEQIGIVDILLFVKVDGEWSAGIPGTGGSSFVALESKGLHTSDEVFKMALTDALSVACKAIGIASNVYLGLPEGKYEAKDKDQPAPKPQTPHKPTPTDKAWKTALEKLKNGEVDKEQIKLGLNLNEAQIKELDAL